MIKLVTVWLDGEEPIYYVDAEAMYDASDRTLTVHSENGSYAVWNTDYVVGFTVEQLEEIRE